MCFNLLIGEFGKWFFDLNKDRTVPTDEDKCTNWLNTALKFDASLERIEYSKKYKPCPCSVAKAKRNFLFSEVTAYTTSEFVLYESYQRNYYQYDSTDKTDYNFYEFKQVNFIHFKKCWFMLFVSFFVKLDEITDYKFPSLWIIQIMIAEKKDDFNLSKISRP